MSDPFPTLDEVPLFPLPDGALLPGELLPLHVFEPRYRLMLEHARRGNKLIAVATLAPERTYDDHGRPALLPVVGVGRLVRDRENQDGTSDIVLKGVARAHVASELAGRPYRRAHLRLFSPNLLHPAEQFRLRRRLLTGLAARVRQRRLRFDLTAETDPGALVDKIASLLELNGPERVGVLQSVSLGRRIDLLLELLSRRHHRQRLLEIVPSLESFTLTLDAEPRP